MIDEGKLAQIKNIFDNRFLKIKGITRRWLLNTLFFISLVLILIGLGFLFIIKGYFYSSIQQSLRSYSLEFYNVFNEYESRSVDAFDKKAIEYTKQFEYKKVIEITFYNNNDEPIANSTGFLPDENQEKPDYNKAKLSSDRTGEWSGRLTSGENVSAITRAFYNSSGEYYGAIRYIVSMENADRKILTSGSALLFVILVIIIFVILSGLYFIKTIINPVREIGMTAKKIALGDFDYRIDKRYDDEIGELCDIINYMAGELRNTEKIKNDFISSISHELRTPLTAIKGWAETIMSGVLSGEAADQEMTEKGLSIIVHESERLSGIVEELLDFSRIQTGKMKLRMDKMDVLAELAEAVYMFKERSISECKELKWHEPRMLSPIFGDKNRLKQVFINILDNSFKYTQKGGVISVSAKEDNGQIIISVTDNGYGIPKQHMPRIKEKFYKANMTQRGSGIGLAVADEIIQLHKGILNIASEENLGTTVTITLPAMTEMNNEKGI